MEWCAPRNNLRFLITLRKHPSCILVVWYTMHIIFGWSCSGSILRQFLAFSQSYFLRTRTVSGAPVLTLKVDFVRANWKNSAVRAKTQLSAIPAHILLVITDLGHRGAQGHCENRAQPSWPWLWQNYSGHHGHSMGHRRPWPRWPTLNSSAAHGWQFKMAAVP